MAGQCELGVTGLATMGANLARNVAGNGFPVAVHNRTEPRTRELLERHGDEGELVGSSSVEEFVAALARPRRILVMVKVGPAVDAVEAYEADSGLRNLLFADYFRDGVAQAQDAWRRVVATAAELGIAAPAFASSLAYYDGFRRERGPANLLQAQRDFFGAHTYRRVDRPGTFHTLWSEGGQEVEA
jgi:6-phosphogluconate dehydrogenase